jgi:hypothetical protein
MVCAASATTVTLVPIAEGEPGSPTNPLEPSQATYIYVTSDAGLYGLDAVLTIVSGQATILTAIGDPWMPFDPWTADGALPPEIDFNGQWAEICMGTFAAPPSGVVGWFVLRCQGQGTVTVQLSPGSACGGSMDEYFGTPNIQGSLEIHQGTAGPDPNCLDPRECAGQYCCDITCDGAVNLADMFALKAHFGKSAPWTDPECCADCSLDNVINLADLFQLKACFGSSGYVPSTGNQNCPP